MPRSRAETEELVRILTSDYQAGMTLKQLERKHDVAASYIGRLLQRHGVQLRPPGSATVQRREGWGGLNGEQVRSYRERLAQQGPGAK